MRTSARFNRLILPISSLALALSAEPARAATVAGGIGHSIVVNTNDGTVWAWGANSNGQLGDNTLTPRPTPIQVTSLANVVAVGAGYLHSVALKADGTLWTWGSNAYGQLGTGDLTSQKIPVQVLTNVVAVAAGAYHTVALKQDGSVWTWGLNSSGQLGDGGTVNRSTPGQVTGLAAASGVAAGGSHSLVILAGSGAMKSWGRNASGELGIGSTSPSNNPVSVSVVSGAVDTVAGYYFTAARKADGTFFSWGENAYGQLGLGDSVARTTPALAPATNIAALAVGSYHALAILAGGTASAWGYNGYGAVGDGSTTHRNSPVTVVGPTSVVAVAGGQYHSLAVTSTGEVWAWGYNGYSQIGDGTTVQRLSPVKVAEAGFAWKAPTPTLSPVAGIYSSTLDVTVATSPAGATLRYTTDGTDPTPSSTPYTAPVAITASTTLKARASVPGKADSNVASGQYTLKVATPSFTPAGGTYTAPQSVTMSTSSPGATIRYTTDGTTPTSNSSAYVGAVSIATTTTVKAVGFRTGWTDSDIQSRQYTMSFGQVAAPTFSPTPGTQYDTVVVTISASAGSTIRYTITGADPTASSPIYTAPVALFQTTTVKAKAFRVDYTDSVVSSATYTVKLSAPTLSLPSGTYPAGTAVNVSAAASGASLYFTLNGQDPTEADTPTTAGDPLVLGNFMLKVRAFKPGCTPSDVSVASFVTTGQLSQGTLAEGAAFGLLLRPDGTIIGWGQNVSGQLGDGSTTARSTPIGASGLTGVTSIAVGRNHALAVTQTGVVWAWGVNGNGQLGDGTKTTRLRPVRVTGLSDAVAVAAGGNTSAVLKSDGTLWLWGANASGQLGIGDTTERLTPVSVMTGVVEVTVGTDHVIARKAGGSVWAWGLNTNGQLGDGSLTSRTSPVQVAGLGTDIVHVETGDSHSVALASTGWVWTWGSNYYGQACDGSGATRTTPVRVVGVLASSVAAGAQFTVITKRDGTVWSCGFNMNGQLGDGTNTGRSWPVPLPLAGIASVVAGETSTFAISGDQAVWAWGANYYAQLGDGTAVERWLPLNVALPGFRWRAAAPVFSRPGGVYSAPTSLTLSTATEGASIRFTVDGTSPTTASPQYLVPIQIDRTTEVKALTVSGTGADSNIETSRYELQATTPQFTPGPATRTSSVSVTMTTSTAGATIRYTTDGQLPSEASTIYYAALPVDTNTTLRARAFKDGWTPSTSVIGSYLFNLGTLPAPALSPAGGQYLASVQVSMSAAAGATIRYTLDGTDPTTNSPAYPSALQFMSNTTVKAKAFHPDWSASPTSTATYTVKPHPPTLSLASGAYAVGQALTLSASDAGAVVRYTLDGSTPTTTSSAVASGTTLRLARGVTVKAVAHWPNCDVSDVVAGVYATVGAAPSARLTGGSDYSVALLPDASVWVWGSNGWAQLGIGTNVDQLQPVTLTALTGALDVDAGHHHSIGILPDGTVSTWGDNSGGALGDGTQTMRLTPVNPTVVGSPGIGAVAAGMDHTLLVTSGGGVAAWGRNSAGQLGDGSTNTRISPVTLSGVGGIVRVAAGDRHSLALNTDGTVLAWGLNSSGQLGDGTATQRNTPVPVPSLAGVVAIAAGASHSLALTSSGAVWSWGSNAVGQLGNGSTTSQSSPVPVTGLTGVIAIAASGQHSLALRQDGSVWSWGYNNAGAVGDGTTVDRITPVLVASVPGAVAIGAGASHSLAFDVDGALWTWGHNTSGQLGDGGRQPRLMPARISQSSASWTVAMPQFGLLGGSYTAEKDVVVTCATAASTIHYTLNGAEPTETIRWWPRAAPSTSARA